MSKDITYAEVWTVVIGNLEEGADFERYEYHVVANSVSQAEKKGLKLAKGEDNLGKPYCRSVSFEFNVVL